MFSKFIKDFGFAGLGEFSYVITNYAVTLVISWSLGAEGVGLYTQGMAVILLFAAFARLGLDTGILRFITLYLIGQDSSHIQGIIRFTSRLVFLTGIILSGSLFITAHFLARVIFEEPQLVLVFQVFAVTIPLVALRTLWLSGIQAFQQTNYRILIEKIIVPLLSFGTIVLFFYWGLRWRGIFISVILTAMVGSIAAFYAYNQAQKKFILNFSATPPKFAIREWLLFCYPLFFSDLIMLVLSRITIFILSFFQNSAEVGIYEIVTKVILLVQMPLAISNFIFAPILAQMSAQGDNLKLQSTFKIVTKWIFALSLLIFLVVTWLAQPILATFGAEFVGGTSTLYVLAIGYLFDVSTGAVGWMLIVNGHSKVHLLNSVVSLILLSSLGFIFVPIYGILGAAIATCLVEVIVNFVRLLEVFYLLKLHPYRWDFLKPVLAGILTLGTIYFLQLKQPLQLLNWTNVIIAGSIFTLYIAFLILFHWRQIRALHFNPALFNYYC